MQHNKCRHTTVKPLARFACACCKRYAQKGGNECRRNLSIVIVGKKIKQRIGWYRKVGTTAEAE